jgi:outer membrane receptor protein involved in Fe transport
MVDSLSNFFVFNRTQNTPGINFRINNKKHNVTFGTSVDFNQFEKKDLTKDIITNYNFVNLIPRASYTYKFKPTQTLRINYNGSTNAPTPEQLQPTRVNTDPLNVYIGNPGLKQSFRSNMGINFNSNNVLKEKYMFTNFNFSFTDNAFVQSSTIDNTTGKRTYQTVNADGNYNVNFNMYYGFKIKGFSWRNNIGPNFNLNRSVEFINGVKSINNTKSYILQIGTDTYKPEKYNAWISARISWNDSKSSVNSAASADYWAIVLNGSGSKTIKKFDIGSNLELQLRQKDPRFPQNSSFTTWNGFITKRFFKENQFELKLQVNDILNENKGYDRNFRSYSFTETYYTTLRRFWLLTATWNISKNGKPTKMF